MILTIEFSCVNPIQGSFTCPTLRTCVYNTSPFVDMVDSHIHIEGLYY